MTICKQWANLSSPDAPANVFVLGCFSEMKHQVTNAKMAKMPKTQSMVLRLTTVGWAL
jgi:hypothetical protein